jgi:hypothetical protein
MEVRMPSSKINHNSALSDGFPAEFYQVFWNMVKEYLMALFHEFHQDSLPIHNSNFGTIILLPKGNDIKQI